MPGVVVINQTPVELFDEDGNPVTVVQEGSTVTLMVNNVHQMEMLRSIYVELRKMNIQLAHMTDMDLDDVELEDFEE
jgi:hypothetical protein